MKGTQTLKLGGGYATFMVCSNKHRTLYVLNGEVTTRRRWERATPTYLAHPGPILASRSPRKRKAAIFAALRLRPCWHDDWEIVSHGGGGCSEFPEPVWYTRVCAQCGRSEQEPDGSWYEPDESWRDYEL